MLNELSITSSMQFFAVHARGRAVDERIGERQHEQQKQQRAQRQQQQIAQAAMLDGALRAPLEKHQRAERVRRGRVAPQQVHIEGQGHRRNARQKPGSEEAHLVPPLADREIFAQGVVERLVGDEQVIIHPRAARFVPQRLRRARQISCGIRRARIPA